MTTHLIRCARILVPMLFATSLAMAATLTITVTPSIGPAADSAFYDTYRQNAEIALENNLTAFGTAGTPGYYTAAANPIYAGALFATPSFNSWLGLAPPPAGYQNEKGNALYFGLTVTGGSFTLADVSFLSDFANSDLTGVVFSNHTVGKNGVNRYDAANPANDAQVIDTLWTSGINVNFAAANPTALDNLISTSTGGFTATYNIDYLAGTNTGTGSFSGEIASPEPGTMALLGIGFCLVGCFKKKQGTLKN